MDAITDQELHAIEEQLNAEITLIQKYKMYASITTDPQIKAKCEQLAGAHRVHCQRLLRCMDE